MRKAFSVAALVLALGCPTFAGIIHNPAPQPAQSPATAPTQETTADGEIPNTEAAADTVTEAVLGLLESVLALL